MGIVGTLPGNGRRMGGTRKTLNHSTLLEWQPLARGPRSSSLAQATSGGVTPDQLARVSLYASFARTIAARAGRSAVSQLIPCLPPHTGPAKPYKRIIRGA